MNERRPRVIEPVYTGYKSHQEAEAADRAWWHSLTPMERLAHLEIARQYAYGPRYLNEDFREFLKCLNDAGVEYLLIGGHAVAYHGYVRPTTDMDVWIALDRANAERVVEAVRKFFGTEMKGLSPEWFLDPENVSRFGVRPFLIEILTKVDGGDFKAAFLKRIKAQIDGVATNVIALDDLKMNKRASGRNKDLADLDNLP